MGLLSGLWSAITGRNREQESDLYANYQMVDTVVEELNSIATTKVMNASDEVCAAMKAINNVKGMEQFVGTISVSNFETAFDTISDTIKGIATQLQGKAEDIKRYEESSTWEKVTSTFAMGATKFAEGLLTPLEEIGDFAVGLVGWLSPKDSGVEKWCTDFVKKDWAHDAFNFYYNSDFADKSVFREEGLGANAILVGGKTLSLIGLMGIPGGVAGPTGLILSGWGSGTETGVKNGKSINSAFWTDGPLGAALQATLPLVLPTVVGLPILPGAAINQFRNSKATEKMKEMAPAIEIKEAVPGTEAFTPVAHTEPGTGTGPVKPTEAKTEPKTGGNENKTEPDTGGGGGQQQKRVDPTEPKTEIKTEPKTEPKPGGGDEYKPIPQTGWPGGGEYSEDGYKADDASAGLAPLDESLLDGTTSISDILDGKSITKVKTNAPISGKSRTNSSSSKVIPIAAGLSAAAAAGIGAKAYLDSRDNNDMDEEDEDEEFEEVDWSDENAMSAENYDQPISEDSGEDFELNEENNYYTEDNNSYSARNNEELAELQ